MLIPDPVYPVYVDTNRMDGRRLVFLQATEENGFLPMPPEGQEADLIYLCSPNNPTGACYTYEQLTAWVQYAISQNNTRSSVLRVVCNGKSAEKHFRNSRRARLRH